MKWRLSSASICPGPEGANPVDAPRPDANSKH
jgi:hypothetical protein